MNVLRRSAADKYRKLLKISHDEEDFKKTEPLQLISYDFSKDLEIYLPAASRGIYLDSYVRINNTTFMTFNLSTVLIKILATREDQSLFAMLRALILFFFLIVPSLRSVTMGSKIGRPSLSLRTLGIKNIRYTKK